MSGDAGAQDEAIVGINVTPLVDVVLVLLVVLMVTAPLLSSEALPLDLPRASTASEQRTPMSIELAADGRLAVDGKVLSGPEAVYPLARRARAEHGDVRVVVRADGDVPHARVVRTMDDLRRAEITKIAFATSGAPVALEATR